MQRLVRIAFLTAVVWPSLLWANEPLRMVASSSWNMPFGKFENEKLVGGIVYDLGLAIAKQLDTSVTFAVLPRKRIDGAVLSGDIDLRCYTNPLWTDVADNMVWSPKLFELTDVIFGGEATPEPRTLQTMPQGAMVSAVLGYGYPTLEPLFDSGKLKRDDASDQEKALLKMTAGRTPYGVSESLALAWYQRITANHRLSRWSMVIARQDFQCAVPRKGNFAAPVVLRAIDQVNKSGKLDEILRNYR